MTAFTFGSLFAGIGGMDLGLERAGMVCRWQVEVDPYCLRVLAKHWPEVPKFGDIREVTGDELERVDLICGGFPCQDISVAGKQAGLDGARSGLWSEYVRLIRVVRPRFVLVENVPNLLVLGMGRVLGDLAESGYDAEWDCISAAAVGAPHIRDRLFLLAYPACGQGREERQGLPEQRRSWGLGTGSGESRAGHVADSPGARRTEGLCTPGGPVRDEARGEEPQRRGFAVAQPERPRLALGQRTPGERPHPATAGGGWWATEPDVCRVAHGVPARVDRLRGLGNAVVPQVAEWLGRRILECDQGREPVSFGAMASELGRIAG